MNYFCFSTKSHSHRHDKSPPHRTRSNEAKSKSSRFDRFKDRSTDEDEEDDIDDIELNDDEKEEQEIERRRRQRQELINRIQKKSGDDSVREVDETSNERTNLSSSATTLKNGNDSLFSPNINEDDSSISLIDAKQEKTKVGPTTFESILKNNSQKGDSLYSDTDKKDKDNFKQYDMFADEKSDFVQVERNNDHSKRNQMEAHPSLIDNWDDSDGYYRMPNFVFKF